MSVIAGVLLSLLVIALLGILIGVLIVRAVYRSIRRNRTINGAVLRTRTAFTWGPQQQVLRLRMRLNDSLESGRAAVELTLRSDGLRGELVRLFKRIQAEGSTLESQLRLLQSETDTAALTAELPVVRGRVEQVEGLVRRLRSAVSSGLGAPSDDALDALRADVDREVAAIHAGIQELHTLNSFDGRPEPRRQTTNRLYGGNES
jgi:hypothetical protein